MRWTATVLGRVRPGLASRVTDLARRDAQRSWSRKTANLLDVALRNLAPIDWRIVQKFADLPPHKSDVEPLLPRLENWARAPNSDPHRIHTVGSLALQHELLPLLSPSFSRVWLAYLQKTNPYRAIEIWKKLGSKDAGNGALIYLAANQLGPALELANTLEVFPRDVIRGFISRSVEQDNFEMAQLWINRWQNPLPEDVRWLHHFLRERNVADKFKVPSLAESTYPPAPCINIGQGLQRIVSSANKLIVLDPNLLKTAVQEVWIEAMSEPSAERLNEFVFSLAKYTRGPFTKEQIQMWIAILRLCSSNTALRILQEIAEWIPPKAFAVVISRSDTHHFPGVLALIPPESLYTPECLSALARKRPADFLELILPPEELETTLKEHHLISLWSASPPEEIKSWLVPLTLQHLHSARLLKAALRCLVGQNDRLTAQTLLDKFASLNLEFDPKLFSNSNSKLPKPQNVKYSEEERKLVVEDAMERLFDTLK